MADVQEVLNLETAREIFSYDPLSGKVTRRVRMSGNALAGSEVGSLNSEGYRCTKFGGRPLKVHRLAWLLAHGSWPQGQIDHKNGDRSDNRLENLRDVTASVNARNMAAKASSGLRGVYRNRAGSKKGWYSLIRIDGRTKYLGAFSTKGEAAASFEAALIRRDGWTRSVSA